jgi:hypothetical protein
MRSEKNVTSHRRVITVTADYSNFPKFERIMTNKGNELHAARVKK